MRGRRVGRTDVPRQHLSQRARFDVLTRCNYACFYCGTPAVLGVVRLEIEHVVPVAQGGTNDPWNLVAACADCNAGKAASSPLPEVMEAAAKLYASWSGRPNAVRLCQWCRRPWVPDAEDMEPNDECWPCVFAWSRGNDNGKIGAA